MGVSHSTGSRLYLPCKYMKMEPQVIPHCTDENRNRAGEEVPEFERHREHPSEGIDQNKAHGIDREEFCALREMFLLAIPERPVLVHEEHIGEYDDTHRGSSGHNRE